MKYCQETETMIKSRRMKPYLIISRHMNKNLGYQFLDQSR